MNREEVITHGLEVHETKHYDGRERGATYTCVPGVLLKLDQFQSGKHF